MKRAINKFKDGAASFYVVAFSTLILVVIAVSFATAIVAEVTRTANDDLAQSAYDAALAGVEDAKLAYMNYRNCIKNGTSYENSLSGGAEITCQDIVYWMNNRSCDMVAHILGRIPKSDTEGGEVLIEETTSAGGAGSNNMDQAYTCVKIGVSLSDYQSTLSSENSYQVVKVRLDSGVADNIDKVRIKWYATPENDDVLAYSNFLSGSDTDMVAFQPTTNGVATPPTLAVQLIQTAQNFRLEELNSATQGGRTDRATVYMVPTDDAEKAANESGSTYKGVYRGGENLISKTLVASTNDRAKDVPFLVYCGDDETDDFVCSATLELPKPIGWDSGNRRNDDTFMFVVSLPYNQPETDFKLEFLCSDGVDCGSGSGSSGSDNVASQAGMQISVDSTGRANNLYRRVELRLDSVDSAMTYPFYAVELLGTNGNDLEKNLTVTKEYVYNYED